jgi:hypothetical protein
MTALERYARDAWRAWGSYAKYTFCHGCRELAYCRSRGGQRFLCLDCHDQRR